jgi:hypothetical protein
MVAVIAVGPVHVTGVVMIVIMTVIAVGPVNVRGGGSSLVRIHDLARSPAGCIARL